jgi:hypothetical protein
MMPLIAAGSSSGTPATTVESNAADAAHCERMTTSAFRQCKHEESKLTQQ